MANRKYSEDTALASWADGDSVTILDVSDTTDGAGGTSKKTTYAQIKTMLDALYQGYDQELQDFADSNITVTGDALAGIAGLSMNGVLNISWGGQGFVIGADLNASTRTNNTAKYGRLSSAHYTNTEETVTLIHAQSVPGDNLVIFGGGLAAQNASTRLSFFTAANYITTTGIERMRITSDGGVFMYSIKSGATQAAAGAAANEVWKTASHATLPDNVLMIGV